MELAGTKVALLRAQLNWGEQMQFGPPGVTTRTNLVLFNEQQLISKRREKHII